MSEQVCVGGASRPATFFAARHALAYRGDIDGLRALAVAAVVIGHFWPAALPGGYIGVDVFFVISGYLITQILTREMAQGRFELLRFYERRARRLFPALFVVLAATAMGAWFVMLPFDMVALLQALLATLLFSANLLFWRQATNYFDATETVENPLLHLWSLGVEEQFYLVFPWLLLGAFALAARRAREPLPLLRQGLWLLAGLTLVLAAVVSSRNSNAAFYLSPLRGWEFMLGSLAALQPRWAPGLRWQREALSWTSLLVLLACMALYSAHTPFPGWAAVPPVLATAVLLHGGGQSTAGRLLSLPPLVGLGLISYSLYLWHWPVLVLGRHQQAMMPPAWAEPAWLLLALLLSVLSWRFVEQPWRRPAALRPPGAWAWVLAALLGLASLAALGLKSQGFEQRLPTDIRRLDSARSAPIPFHACHDRPLEQACLLGERGAPPELLLWGDSHLLSWAPALDRALAGARRSALVSAQLACAPLLSLDNTKKRSCAPGSEAVWAHLQSHPRIRTVVIAAYWSHYFRMHSPSSAVSEQGQPLQGLAAATHGLNATLAQLLARGYEVVLIGPVPVYSFNVPQTLALHAWREQPMPVRRLEDQTERLGPFWQAMAPWHGHARLRVIDPAPWFCGPACVLQAEGQALYRDEQHLSEAGALWAAPRLASALASALGNAARPVPP